MPTDPAILATVADNARRSPLSTLVAHLSHLVNAVEWANTSPERLTVKVDEARAVLDAVATTPPTPPAPRFFAVYIGTTNDTNGNPRRGWLMYDLNPETRGIATWIEEGYRGTSAPVDDVARVLGLPSRTWGEVSYLRSLVRETGRIDVTPGEYRAARKLPRFGGGVK